MTTEPVTAIVVVPLDAMTEGLITSADIQARAREALESCAARYQRRLVGNVYVRLLDRDELRVVFPDAPEFVALVGVDYYAVEFRMASEPLDEAAP